MQLKELQTQLMAEITSQPRIEPMDFLTKQSFARIPIYQNNYAGSLTKALANLYPVTERLLGESYFKQICAQYIRKYPSQSFNLNHYGLEFAEFIGSLQAYPKYGLTDLHYLVDILHLELAVYLSLFGPQNSLFDLQAFADLPLENQIEVVFRLAENGHTVNSCYPIDRIWEMNQTTDVQTPDLTADVKNIKEDAEAETDENSPLLDLGDIRFEEQTFIIWRREFDIHIYALNAGEKFLIESIKEEKTLKQIFAEKISEELKEAISLAIPKLLSLGYITGFRI